MGEYSPANGDWKTFGSVGQGPIMQAVKQINSNDCEQRSVFITIYALTDFEADKKLHLQFGSWSFDEPAVAPATVIENGEPAKNTIDWGKIGHGAFISVSSLIFGTSLFLASI